MEIGPYNARLAEGHGGLQWTPKSYMQAEEDYC